MRTNKMKAIMAMAVMCAMLVNPVGGDGGTGR